MKKFIVDRSKWINANHGIGTTYLLNNEGYRCCLGFVCNQLGIDDKKLLNQGLPNVLNMTINGFTEPTDSKYITNTVLSVKAIEINDTKYFSLEQRETDLINLFREYGYTLEFRGSYEKV